ncbi:MAG TPA: DUF488 domain-containing protein [Gemmatimonadota bacterium]|nr:DUF488 domain-containing protein [Gemmatimonadota bacterium]
MTAPTTLYTIGFTKKSAETFFGLLREAGVRRVIDVRLNNTSQLAAFAKKDDLAFFLGELGGIEYLHVPEMAPTQELVDLARKKKDRDAFEERYRALIEEREVELLLPRETLDRACLLCSEHRPRGCHRRVLAEYLAGRLGDVRIEHLL